MDSSRAFSVVRKPPILDKSNYEEWKIKTMVKIGAIDDDIWTAVEYGWETPKLKYGFIKPKGSWTNEEKRLSKFNAKALQVIFEGIDTRQFKLIQDCESAREALFILQRTFERTNTEKIMQLKILDSKFESLKMGQEDKVADFSLEILYIASEAEALGEKYEEKKLVKKLLQCFNARLCGVPRAGVQTSSNIDGVKFHDLRNVLIAREMSLEIKKLEKQNL